MKGLKIYVYAISKNESKFVDRWMDSVGEADGVIVADTGSEDDTVEKLRARGAVVFEETFQPWRFDTARNAALGHVPEDADICVSNDMDEVFEPGWRSRLEEAWNSEYTRGKYWFVWQPKSDDVPEKKFIMEKMHIRQGYKWVHPVHEVLEYSGTEPENVIMIDSIRLIHKPDPDKKRTQYLPLLELSIEENPNDDRVKFWLGREYIFNNKYEKAIQTLSEYLKMPTAMWDEERSAAMRFIAWGYLMKNDNKTALSWLYKSIAECPGVREPWLELSRFAYRAHDWELLMWACERGLQIIESTNSYLVDINAWGYELEDYAAIAYSELGCYERAREHAENAHKLAPDNERLKNNLTLIQQELDGGVNHV